VTPYELERTKERLEDATQMAQASNTPMTLLVAISKAMSEILQHLSDVEGDLNIERNAARRDAGSN